MEAKILRKMEEVAGAVKTRNSSTLPHKSDAYTKIKAFPLEKQNTLFASLNEYMEIISEPEGLPRRQTDLVHLKKFLRRKGLLVKDAGYEDMILDGDLIEVYDASGAQVFRNIEFFNYSSYTVWEVATESWENLYYRSPVITNIIMQEWVRIVKSDGLSPLELRIPKHVIREIGGECNQCEIFFKYGWPVFDAAGAVQGTMVTVQAQRLPSSEQDSVGFI